MLFEIVRRLATVDKTSEEKKEFDVLPIGSVIARLVKLLEHGDNKTCKFKDVLIAKEKSAATREDSKKGGKQSTRSTRPLWISRRKGRRSLARELIIPSKSLKKCSDQIQMCLTKKMKNLNLRERKHLPMTSEIDAESNLSEDYSDSDWNPSMWGNKFSRWQRRISFYFFSYYHGFKINHFPALRTQIYLIVNLSNQSKTFFAAGWVHRFLIKIPHLIFTVHSLLSDRLPSDENPFQRVIHF